MQKYTIGLDIGENNVGWAIYDNESNKIEDYGVRLFSVADGAVDRRTARNTRRRLKRKNNRVVDALNKLREIKFPNSITIDSNLIYKRVKGLTDKLEKQDIVNIICYMMNYRGYIPYGDEEVNFANLNGLYPCEFYYNLYKEEGYYRNSNLVVKNTDNLKELIAILKKQAEFYSELNDKFINDISVIFTRKRKFWEGPGSINSLSKYGRFNSKESVEEFLRNKELNPNYEKYLYEDLIGTCSISIGEKCAPKLNFYAEYFNFLNDFINISFIFAEEISNKQYISISNDIIKLNKEGLLAIKDYCLNNTSVTYVKILKDVIGTNISNVRGYRVDKKGKPEFSTFNFYRSVIKTLVDNGLSLDWAQNIDMYNRIMYIFNVVPGKVELFNMIINDPNYSFEFNENELEIIYELYLKMKKEFGYHSLSESILKRAINDMERTCLNFMQVRKKYDYDKNAREYFIKNYCDSVEGLPKINKKFVDDIIASPQVKKALRQSIKVINEIIKKKKCYPETISIESTHEMNGKEKRNEIISIQKKQEELRKRAKQEILSRYGESKLNETNILKTMLYYEIDGQCMYCSKPITLDEVLSAGFDIEHILPYSQSFNDSFENKTIACSKCNHDKLNRTPYVYLNSLKMYEEFKEKVQNLKISDEKKKNLLFEDDLDKYSIRFFNRNLRDTAYATSELVNQIKIFNYYLEANFNDLKINTFSTPGQLTSNMRRKYNLEKDRDDGVYHHAVDASIIASIPNTPVGKYLLKSQNDDKFYLNNKDDFKNKLKREERAKFIYSINIDNTIDVIKNINNDTTKTSMQLNKSPQKALANANIIKLIKKDDDFKKIKQINNIYMFGMNDYETLVKLFDDNNNSCVLLCKENNINQYNMLKEIFNKYSENKKENPFVNYCLEKNGIENPKDFNYKIHGIRMSNKKNSPVVVRLRYYESITEPYLIEKKNINKKDKTYIALDSLAQYCTKVYVDLDKNKFVFMPIYSISVDLKTGIVKENDKFYKLFYDKYLKGKNLEFVCDLYNGNYVEIIKKESSIPIECYFSGFDKSANRIELKERTRNKNMFKRNFIFTSSDKGLILYDVDTLGNKHVRLTKILD